MSYTVAAVAKLGPPGSERRVFPTLSFTWRDRGESLGEKSVDGLHH
jgi:hypothetical protein